MKKIVILGASVAGAKAAEEIRQQDQSCEISMVSTDGFYPCDYKSFAPFLSKEINSDKVFYQPNDFYQQNNINVILDKKINRVNFNRKRVFFDSGKNR